MKLLLAIRTIFEQMKLHLSDREYGGMAVGFLLVVLLSYLSDVYIGDPGVIENYTRFVMSAVVLSAVFFIHRAVQSWAGEFARYLELIGAGLSLVLVTWVPHIGWHVSGQPPMLGVGPGFWLTFFHGLNLMGFIIVAYGFYLFWKRS